MEDQLSSQIWELVQRHITAPSFQKEPHNYALSGDTLLHLCRSEGIAIDRARLEQLLLTELRPYLWSEINCGRIYITGIRRKFSGQEQKS